MVSPDIQLKDNKVEGVALTPNLFGEFEFSLNFEVGQTYPDNKDHTLTVVELHVACGMEMTQVAVSVATSLADQLPHRCILQRRFRAVVKDGGLALTKVDLFNDGLRWITLFTPA